MFWTLERLQAEYNLTQEDVTKTLKACNLPSEQNEYSNEDIQTKFKIVRGYFDSNRTDTYTGAADLFMQEHGIAQSQLEPEFQTLAKKSARGRKTSNSTEGNNSVSMSSDGRIDISFLLAQACQKSGRSISLTEALKILEACGLPDTEEYTQEQCDRFVEACDLISKQGKSYSEVAAHFGINGSNESKLDNLQQIVEQISDQAVSAESGLLGLVNKITEKRAEGIPGLVNKLFLKNVSRKLVESQSNNDIFFAELEERIMAQIEGKFRARSLEATWEWAPKELPHSSPKPMSLPEGSDNGISDE